MINTDKKKLGFKKKKTSPVAPRIFNLLVFIIFNDYSFGIVSIYYIIIINIFFNFYSSHSLFFPRLAVGRKDLFKRKIESAFSHNSLAFILPPPL